MEKWTKLTLNPAVIENVFDSPDGLLENVDLHEILLHRDGPRVALRFDVAKYPASPPAKWRIQNFNRVQIQLSVIGVNSLSINGWKEVCKVDLSVSRKSNYLCIAGKNDDVSIEICGNFLNIDVISAYQDC